MKQKYQIYLVGVVALLALGFGLWAAYNGMQKETPTIEKKDTTTTDTQGQGGNAGQGGSTTTTGSGTGQGGQGTVDNTTSTGNTQMAAYSGRYSLLEKILN